MARKTSSERIAPKRVGRRHLVAVVAFDGVVLGDLAIPCEIFGRAISPQGAPLYDVRICSSKRTVRSRHVALQVPEDLSLLRRADTVIVPGLEDIEGLPPKEFLRAIRLAGQRGARVASICTGAFVLAATGLLDGRQATTHWYAAAKLAQRHPGIEVDPNVLYVDNGKILTSAGAAAGHDLCLHMIRRDLGAEAAALVARFAVMPLERAGGQAQFIVHQPPALANDSMGPLLTWLEENLDAGLSLRVIARRAGMSTRTLSRRFRDEVGATPAAWVTRARVRRAQALLEKTDLSVERVAEATGFGSAVVLRTQFREVVGTSPQHYRRSFRERPHS